jgi:hypothetical protein
MCLVARAERGAISETCVCARHVSGDMGLGQNVPNETVQHGDVGENGGGAFGTSLLPLVGPRQRLQTEKDFDFPSTKACIPPKS